MKRPGFQARRAGGNGRCKSLLDAPGLAPSYTRVFRRENLPAACTKHPTNEFPPHSSCRHPPLRCAQRAHGHPCAAPRAATTARERGRDRAGGAGDRSAVRRGGHGEQGEDPGQYADARGAAILGTGGGGGHSESLRDGQYFQRPHFRRAGERRREGDRGGAVEGPDLGGDADRGAATQGDAHPQGNHRQAGRHPE